MIDRQVIEWDKDDIDALKFMKVDVLALGMLTCMKKAFDLLAEHKGVNLDLATIPAEDPRTYAMIRKADTLGTFQIESRAQMSMLPRIKPRTFYDLEVEVAIVRPGPIQGDMVHPYLRRREGLEPVIYPKPELEQVLGKTLGVPLFQEQALRVAIVCAGFTPGEGDQLRKSMATFKFTGGVSAFWKKLIAGMAANGYEQAFAEQTFKQLEGFDSYGFPESHAASFALIAYASSWVKCWHPNVFCAALLNSRPMGFYAPAQIVRDAQAHGVEIRPICTNASRWDSTLESTGGEGLFTVRLGMRMVKGLANAHAATILAARGDRPFLSVDDLWRRAGVPSAALAQLAEADAFRPALGLLRHEALWAIKALRDEPLSLFAAAAAREDEPVSEIDEPTVVLRRMTAGSEVVQDYGHIGLTLRRHPITFLRDDLAARRMVTCTQAMDARDGRRLEAGRPRACPSAARQRQRRDVHHPGGRDRDRQPGGLAAGVREISPRRDGRQHDCCARPHSARGRGGPPRRVGSLISQPNWRPSVAATGLSRYRMDAATKSHMPVAASIRASSRPRACVPVTSMFRTCTSTSSKRRAGTSIDDYIIDELSQTARPQYSAASTTFGEPLELERVNWMRLELAEMVTRLANAPYVTERQSLRL